MSSRTGGSTGVIVALVVFVVLTVGLLATSIVLYAGKSDAEAEASKTRSELAKYITPEERERSATQELLGKTGGNSLYGYLAEQAAATGEFVANERGADLPKMRSSLGLDEKDSVKDAMRKLAQERDARTQEANSLKGRVNDYTKEIDALKAQLADAEKAREEAVSQVTKTIASYREAADGYRNDFDAAKASLDQARADMSARYQSEAGALQSEIESLRAERTVLDERISALQRKVSDTTSTCRILRGSGSRPIVKDDVIANAVFNPDYRFKFLVHGKFDINNDGKATVGEADYIKSRIREWGGEVIESDSLPGDLDFLVLGVQPPPPMELASDASESQTIAYTEQRAAREMYDSLFRTATDAEIPVLNWTRFETLTGSVAR